MKSLKIILGSLICILLVCVILFFLMNGNDDLGTKNTIGAHNEGVATSQEEEFKNQLEMSIIAYMISSKSFIELTVSDIENTIQNSSPLLLYTGRVTCEWCRKFVPILEGIASKENLKIYYLDSTNTEEDVEIQKFRKKYEIEEVPSLILFTKDEYYKINFDITSQDFNSEYLQEILEPYITKYFVVE